MIESVYQITLTFQSVALWQKKIVDPLPSWKVCLWFEQKSVDILIRRPVEKSLFHFNRCLNGYKRFIYYSELVVRAYSGILVTLNKRKMIETSSDW